MCGSYRPPAVISWPRAYLSIKHPVAFRSVKQTPWTLALWPPPLLCSLFSSLSSLSPPPKRAEHMRTNKPGYRLLTSVGKGGGAQNLPCNFVPLVLPLSQWRHWCIEKTVLISSLCFARLNILFRSDPQLSAGSLQSPTHLTFRAPKHASVKFFNSWEFDNKVSCKQIG